MPLSFLFLGENIDLIQLSITANISVLLARDLFALYWRWYSSFSIMYYTLTIQIAQIWTILLLALIM